MPRIGQVGAAGAELHLLEIEAEASAAIWASAVQAPWPMSCAPVSTSAGAVAPHHGARLRPGTCRAGNVAVPMPQPTSKPVLVAHLCAARADGLDQPKRVRALRVALAQRLGGERLAGDRLDLGIVPQAEIQRVHAAGLRRLVDRALQRDRCRRPRRARA